MADALAALEAEYCPPLDPALLSAIASDYDLSDARESHALRLTLDQLKESAAGEEAAGFDPSGTGATSDGEAGSEPRAESCPETTGASPSRETDGTSLSNGLSSLDLGEIVGEESDAFAGGHAMDLDGLGEETKVQLLRDVFGARVSKYSIQHTLRKCKGRWQTTLEELLNHVYFDEAGDGDDGSKVAAKGIDAFAEEVAPQRGRKGKGKARKNRAKGLQERRASSLPMSPADDAKSTANMWQTAKDDIEFVASRTRIPSSTVSSAYYANRASVPHTIGALLKATMEESKLVVTDDAAVAASARELGQDFPRIAPDYLAALIRLTHPSTASAHELAKALTAKSSTANGGGLQIITRYAPADARESDSDTEPMYKKDRAPLVLASSGPDAPDAAARARAYASAQATAYSQASAAHRKAKSNRLMGGAAAYYSEVGREIAALHASASASAADQRAAVQSSAAELDLHGIDVLNGMRIAQEKVEAWWEGLGESRVNGRIGAADRRAGYRIVVGVGRHSEGGKGKLGPAVSKSLRSEGWNVENSGAVIVVKGRTN